MSMEGCDYCAECNVCQLCDTGCQPGCDTCQGFCESDQNSYNNFSYSKCVSSGQIICDNSTYFSRETWNEAIDTINNVFSKGRSSAGGRKGCTDPTNANDSKISRNETDTHITAAEFERVASTVGHSNKNVALNAVIYGSYFSDLAGAVAALQYKSYQCDTCNSSCDIECDKCQKCDTGCQGCDAECEDYCCHCCDNDCCDNNKTDEDGEGEE